MVAVALSATLWRRVFLPDVRTASEAVAEPKLLLTAHGGRTLYESVAAPIQITVFSDFQCPYCASLAKTLAVVVTDDPGRLFVRHRHYPRGASHPYAEEAALAAECAVDQ